MQQARLPQAAEHLLLCAAEGPQTLTKGLSGVVAAQRRLLLCVVRCVASNCHRRLPAVLLVHGVLQTRPGLLVTLQNGPEYPSALQIVCYSECAAQHALVRKYLLFLVRLCCGAAPGLVATAATCSVES